jgi:hypothetical protein
VTAAGLAGADHLMEIRERRDPGASRNRHAEIQRGESPQSEAYRALNSNFLAEGAWPTIESVIHEGLDPTVSSGSDVVAEPGCRLLVDSQPLGVAVRVADHDDAVVPGCALDADVLVAHVG